MSHLLTLLYTPGQGIGLACNFSRIMFMWKDDSMIIYINTAVTHFIFGYVRAFQKVFTLQFIYIYNIILFVVILKTYNYLSYLFITLSPVITLNLQSKYFQGINFQSNKWQAKSCRNKTITVDIVTKAKPKPTLMIMIIICW